MMALPVFAQDGAKRALKGKDVAEKPRGQGPAKQQSNLVLEYLGERTAEKANLGPIDVARFEKALRSQVIQSMGDDPSVLQNWRSAVFSGTASNSDFLEKTLSYPGSKAALIAHLSEEQFQQWVSEAQSRNHRKRLAQASQIVAAVDPHLTFSAAQRCALTDTLAADSELGINKSPRARSLTIEVMMRINPNTMLQMLSKPLREQVRESLTPTQATAWELLLPQSIPLQKVKPQKGELKNGNKDSASDHRRDLAVATLAAHTEQLGELDARASKRLELVSKGVVVQHIEALEARDEASEDLDARFEQLMREIREVVAVGRVNGEQDVERMAGLENRLANFYNGDPRSTEIESVTSHPLYQKTIKDVLSEDAYAAYQDSRAKRESFRRQAVRDLVVANLDGQLLFDNAQHKDAQQLSSDIEVDTEAMAYQVLSRVVESIDKDNLSDWQREVFESMLDD